MTQPHQIHPDLTWYRERLRPLVSQHLPDREGEWDQEADRLETLLNGAREELPVCFLGATAVGKSTLINALVTGKEIVLPTTGVGPLTAQAIVVRYGREPSFEVEYHPAQQVAQILFPLEQDWTRASHAMAVTGDNGQVELLVPKEDVEKFKDLLGDGGAGVEEGGLTRLDVLRKQARQLITGKPDEAVEVPYILDGLREALGRKRVWGTVFRPDSGDAERVRRLREALTTEAGGKRHRQSPGGEDFRALLEDHASGFLAPLIRRIEVTWDSPLLSEGLTLIDLPGLGAAGDSFKKVTREYIPQARAVVLTVNRSGIDQASADLLRTSEFLNRLKYAGDYLDEDPVQLLIAAVQIDSVADERFGKNRSRPRREHFRDIQDEMRQQLRNQLREQLHDVWKMGGEPITPREEEVIARLVDNFEVHPVSAVQHRKFLTADDDDRPFINDVTQSGIDAMKDSLVSLARQFHEHRRQCAARRLASFVERVTARLEEFRPPPREQHRRSMALKVRKDFLAYVQQKREEYLRREGQLRGLWTDGVRRLIEAEVEKSSGTAERRIRGYLGNLADAKVSVRTLQAVVRYGGRFSGATRQIDLPHDLALGFDAVMAEVWNDPILRELRGHTSKFASDCASLLEEIVAWAKDHEMTDFIPTLEAISRTIRADAEQLQIVGEESTAHLRKEVRERLIAEIETPIMKRCREFNTSGLNRGGGTKQRILEMFEVLARDVIEASRTIAIQLMTRCVEGVREAVNAVWKNRDPLAPAVKLGETPPPSQVPTPEEQRQQKTWIAIEAALAARSETRQAESIGAH